MGQQFIQELTQRAVEFHGHSCGGLAIGIRAAQFCLERIGHNSQTPLTIVAETDMCGVDALQALTGCTMGKGNLLHRDYGKIAFTFYPENGGKAFRIVLRPDFLDKSPDHDRFSVLMRKINEGLACPAEEQELAELRDQSKRYIMQAKLEDVFEEKPVKAAAPRPAKILESLICEVCGEKTMESRTRRFAGKTLCIPCFGAVEQKLV